jgi:exodeoxyribonuclease V alpha subunit
MPEEQLKETLPDLIKSFPQLFATLPEGRAPVVLSEEGESFYLLKRWRYERRFLHLLDPLIGAEGEAFLPGWDDPRPSVKKAYHDLRENPDLLIGRETLEAAEMVSTRQLSVITGGPGTGKTTLLGGLLRLLLEAGRSQGRAALNIRLCAPTGRAAGRLEESLQTLLQDPRYRDSFPMEPSTLHKLLGLVPGAPPRFNRNRPVPADLIVVDEASMVDLNLMYYILDALRPGGRLLLVGDKDQLPSVEAGALLSDFLYGQGRRGYRLDGAVLALSRVHRNSGAILEGAGLIIQGDTPGFLDFLARPGRKDSGNVSVSQSGIFHYRDIPDFRTFLESMDRAFGLGALKREIPSFSCEPDGWKEYREGIDRYLQLYRDMVILVPSRRGLYGINSLNRSLSAHLAPGEGPVFHGQPVMITRNDYERDLYNGDRGVILEFQGQFYAFFEESRRGGYRHFPISLLGEYQTAFALTIHKSQGSEYKNVTVLIPEGVDRLLSREILYTGITRARERVSLLSRRDLLEQALSRGVRRHSGIREFISPAQG